MVLGMQCVLILSLSKPGGGSHCLPLKKARAEDTLYLGNNTLIEQHPVAIYLKTAGLGVRVEYRIGGLRSAMYCHLAEPNSPYSCRTLVLTQEFFLSIVHIG